MVQHVTTVAFEGVEARAVDGRTLLKRLTLVVRDGVVDSVLYPVFPPDRAAASALDWLQRV